MKDKTSEVLEVFNNYAEAFEKLKPKAVLPFYHYPSILINYETSAAMKNGLEAWLVFTKVMADLRRQNYKESVMDYPPTAKFLSENLAVISGATKRFAEGKKELAHFGFTYTLRKVNEQWKIIVGIIHDVDSSF